MNTRTKARRLTTGILAATIAATAFTAGAVDAGRGPVCNDNEAPVCEDPPPPPPRLTVVTPGGAGFLS